MIKRAQQLARERSALTRKRRALRYYLVRGFLAFYGHEVQLYQNGGRVSLLARPFLDENLLGTTEL
jgi:hypothetical protein